MDLKWTTVFQRNWDSKKKIIINRWWTRSSKTISLLQMILIRLLTWKIDDVKKFDSWVCSIVRKYSSTIDKSILRDWEDIIVSCWQWFLLSEKYRNKSTKVYQFWGRLVEFIWADDEQKIRWSKRDILYCNEGNELRYREEFFQLLIRTTYKVFIDFNPDNEDIWINTEIEQKRNQEEWDVDVIVSTYKDNPFLWESTVKEIERLETIDPAYWRIYWKWEYWRLEWLIFSWRKEIWCVPDWAKLLCRWLDFWFSNDPTCLTALYKFDGWIILDEEIYQNWLTNQDIVALFQVMQIDKLVEIFADSSEPKSIEEIHRCWYNIKPVTKWPDSIRYWIDLMKQNNIFITSRSKNWLREFKWYTRQKDKNWKYIWVPIDIQNHFIDANRYWFLMKFWKTRNVWIYSL